jgi:hypothetical protein
VPPTLCWVRRALTSPAGFGALASITGRLSSSAQLVLMHQRRQRPSVPAARLDVNRHEQRWAQRASFSLLQRTTHPASSSAQKFKPLCLSIKHTFIIALLALIRLSHHSLPFPNPLSLQFNGYRTHYPSVHPASVCAFVTSSDRS